MEEKDDEESFWEDFSKKHPLNVKIKDTDVFLHGTSSKKYSAIQSKGFLKRNVLTKNHQLSAPLAIYFEKYNKYRQPDFTQYSAANCSKNACENKNDRSLDGVILRITGRRLKRLGCNIYVDCNYPTRFIRDENRKPVAVDRKQLIYIKITEFDIPSKYLKVVKRLTLEEMDSRFNPKKF